MNVLGKNLNGYYFQSFINKGGFGAVYKAKKDEQFFAIKVFNEEYVLREYKKHGENNRLKREIEIMKLVNHKNLVSYVDDFVSEDETGKSYFLVMEYIEGKTLRELLNENDYLQEEKAVSIFKQILNGLNSLHTYIGIGDDTGIIHRDLKPENIIIQDNENIKIVDYGISKVIDFTSLTSTGDIFGTGPYMSPEQITDSKNIDKRSDLYTAGVILYEMLTGDFPYEFQYFPELLDKIKNENEYPIRPNAKVSGISNSIENITLKLLEKKPYNRFINVESIITEIDKKDDKSSIFSFNIEVKFLLTLDKDKTLIKSFSKHNKDFGNVIFPIHLATAKSYVNMLSEINKSKQIILVTDPSTNKLTYDGYRKKISLVNLPYSPDNMTDRKFELITPEFLNQVGKIKEYVSKVIDYQLSLETDCLMAPYHYLNNSNSISSSPNRNPFFDWLDLDYKLAQESISYLKKRELNKPLYISIAFNENVFSNEKVIKQLLNKYSLLECSAFVVYVDKIDTKTNSSTLYKYIKFLLALQESTNIPVYAGRVGIIGLGLICAGIAGFTSGPSERDTFYEDLLTNEESYGGTSLKYYFKGLLHSIIIPNRKNGNGKVPPPTKFQEVSSFFGKCDCYYCENLDELEMIRPPKVKLHFMEKINEEINFIKNIPLSDRKVYFLKRIDEALDNFEQLKIRAGIKPSEYSYLNIWKEVFRSL